MTADANKHSPTPWSRNRDGKTLDRHGERVILDGFSLACGYHGDQPRLNDAHIVRCVNAHDELVAALEAAAAFVPQTIGTDGEARPTDIAIKIRAALALARP